MKRTNKKTLGILTGVACSLVFGTAVYAGAAVGSPNEYCINQMKRNGAESLTEYDFGTPLPHDDAYMKGYASGSGSNDVYVVIYTPDGTKSERRASEVSKDVYEVAEVGGQDKATYAYGVATSKIGTSSITIR
ncbi:hypothetical protein GMA11_06500 [Granulicatella sp. zg-ZJ]|uniref:hypothetical protein n=1 Tax=Granulicatella sp. zg-ZJ TaxID=2678504 RepID=UPI0013D1A4A1|nr:hypothetical protein [Granulicatella sp. zg-ZJ]NEW63043.1 hypothetical protein [Granulicatella sp. zg-ZJ]